MSQRGGAMTPLARAVQALVKGWFDAEQEHAAQRVVASLRAHGGVRTLDELVPVFVEVGLRPAPEAMSMVLCALEVRGLVNRRDMVTEDGSQPVWWAPAFPFPHPDAVTPDLVAARAVIAAPEEV